MTIPSALKCGITDRPKQHILVLVDPIFLINLSFEVVIPDRNSQLTVHNWRSDETLLQLNFKLSVRHPSFAGPNRSWILAHLVQPRRFSRPVAIDVERDGEAFRIPNLPRGAIQNIEMVPTAGRTNFHTGKPVPSEL